MAKQQATLIETEQLVCKTHLVDDNKDELPSLVDLNDLGRSEQQLPSTQTDCDIDCDLFDDENPLAS